MVDLREPTGCSAAYRAILETLNKVATTDAEVLIVGPSGVGKELYANFLHNHSRRNRCKLVPVNCGSLSGELIENQLFGHVSGAFTGATTRRDGLIAEADGGTLFFDEVDSLSVPSQIKLLRFLQDKQYRCLGENRLRQADVRIVAATNTCLETAVREGRFRKDLFFRLRVVPLTIPPLKQRPDDIIELLSYFIRRAAAEYVLPAIELSDDALIRLRRYEWPGNIRELENCVEYLTCLQLPREIQPQDLPLLDQGLLASPDSRQDELVNLYLSSDDDGDAFQSVKQRLVDRFEKQYIDRALQVTNGNVSAAARMSGKNRRALTELMRKHQIDPDDYRIGQPGGRNTQTSAASTRNGFGNHAQ